MCLGRHPADNRLARFLRERVSELVAHLFGTDEHDLRSLQPAAAAVEFLRNALEMLLHELLDVTLVARLRPATLVVPSIRLLVEVLRELLQMSGAQAEELTLLASDDRDDRSVRPRDERDE